MSRRTAMVALACALALVAGACDQAGAGQRGAGGTVPAPEFPAGLDWFNTGGRSLTMRELQGTVVAMAFWSGSCITCTHAMPHLERLADEFADRLVVIGVHTPRFAGETTSEAVRAAVSSRSISFPVVADHDLAMSRQWGTEELPTTVLVDPTGRVVGAYTGESPYEALRPAIADLAEDSGDAPRLDLVLERDRLPPTPLSFPSGIAVTGRQDRVYIADTAHHRIVAATLPDGEVIAVYGSGEPGFTDGASAQARLRGPRGLALSDGDSVLYVADTDNHAVRGIDLSEGTVTTIAGTGELGESPSPGGRADETALRSPWDVAAGDGVLYVSMAGSNQLWTIDLAEDRAAPIAGDGAAGVVDGPAADALLSRPSGIALGSDGRLFFADPESSTVRTLDISEERVATVAGAGTRLFAYGDVDAVGDDARFQLPLGVAAGTERLAVADTLNHKLKVVDLPTGRVASLAGGPAGWRDGSDPLFVAPEAVEMIGSTVYVADTGNHVVRSVDLATGAATTLVLRGIDQFAPTADDVDYQGTVVEVPEAAVVAGPGVVVLDIALPSGHKVNGEAPSSVTWQVQGGVVGFSDDADRSLTGVEFPVSYPVTFTEGEGTVTADLSLYWCAEGAESLCFVEQMRFSAPVVVGAEGDDEVRLSYEISLPEIP